MQGRSDQDTGTCGVVNTKAVASIFLQAHDEPVHLDEDLMFHLSDPIFWVVFQTG